MKEAAPKESKKVAAVQRQSKEMAVLINPETQNEFASPEGELSPQRLTSDLTAIPPAQRAPMLLHLQNAYGNRFVQRVISGYQSASQPFLQTKLSVNQPDDPFEREAEAVANRVTAGQPVPSIAPISPGGIVTETRALNTKEPGQPLKPSTQNVLESRMGADFSKVQVHNDSAAHEAAGALNARAFTHQNDIWLGRGESQDDLHLMAHEAAHVVQQGAEVQREMIQRAAKNETGGKMAAQPAEDVAPGVMELQGMTTFIPPAPIDKFLDERKTATVNARFGKMAQGAIKVAKTPKGKYVVKPQPIPLTHPLVARIGEVQPNLQPALVISVKQDQLDGYVGLAAAAKLPGKSSLSAYIEKAPEVLGLVGFRLDSLPKIINNIEGGSLHLGLKRVPIKLGAAFSGTINLEVVNETITFDGSANVNVKGLATGSLELKRSSEGVITGKAAIALKLPKNFSGNVDVAWDGQAITGEGKVGYQGEKLSGEVILRLMDKDQAEQLEQAKKAPPEQAAAPVAPTRARAKKVDYVVFGEGNLTFAFNEWLNGTAHVIIDHKGFVTIIGKITPQKEFILFEQKDYVKKLFKVEARASYGIPVVGNIFIFANVGMDAFAKLGPGKFYNIVIEGTYSTDPKKNKDFSIRGTLNISAAAGLRLRGEAGVGLTILAHDIKAGAGINGIAGIRGYAEATPIIGYHEKAKEGEDKKGEFFIRGELEIAAQPFLGLSGDLFVEIDAPWWSPVPDKKWTWPLGSKEWPIGGSLGIGASVDYVFGSKQWPSIEFKPVDFSAEKFMTDLYQDKAKPRSGEAGDQKGQWKEKNSKDAEPPAGPEKKGNAAPGKAAELPEAKPTVKPGGPKKPAKPVDPNAKTAEGKSVKQLQEEAEKKGKKPEGKDAAKGKGKEGAAKGKEIDKAKPKDDTAAKQMVKSAIDTDLPNGAQQLADINKVLAGVANKVKPILTDLHAEEVMPGKPKNEGVIGFKVKAKGEKGDVLITAVRYSQKGSVLSPEERWNKGVEGVKKAVANLVKRKISEETIKAQFPKWQSEFGFKILTLNTKATPWIIEGEMSPAKEVAQVPESIKAPTGKTSTETDAIPMVWYKPPYLYPFSIKLEGEIYDFNKPSWIEVPDKPGLKDIRASAINGSIKIGVKSKHIPEKGRIWPRVLAKPLRTGRKQSNFRILLSAYNYNWGTKEADHVQDLQWGGDDDYPNLWPLEEDWNRAANAILDQDITYKNNNGNVVTVKLRETPLNRYFRIIDLQKP